MAVEMLWMDADDMEEIILLVEPESPDQDLDQNRVVIIDLVPLEVVHQEILVVV
jgi:hypothetical protein